MTESGRSPSSPAVAGESSAPSTEAVTPRAACRFDPEAHDVEVP